MEPFLLYPSSSGRAPADRSPRSPGTPSSSGTGAVALPSEGFLDSLVDSLAETSSEYTPEVSSTARSPLASRIRAKLYATTSADTHILDGDTLLDNGAPLDEVCSEYRKAIDSPEADAISIVDGLEAIVTAREDLLRPESESLPELERLMAAAHFFFGTDDRHYLEAALRVCTATVKTDRAEENLPLFRRTAAKLLKMETKAAPDVLFTGMSYLASNLISVAELKQLTKDTMSCMEANGDFWGGFDMWFELSYTYSVTCGMDDEADECLLQALDVACDHPDFFETPKAYSKFFMYFARGGVATADEGLKATFLKLESGMSAAHKLNDQLKRQEVSSWIDLTTVFARIGSMEDGLRTIADAQTVLQLSPPIERDIWCLDEPYRGLRQLWETCLLRGYKELARETMKVVLEAADRWLGNDSPEFSDASVQARLEGVFE